MTVVAGLMGPLFSFVAGMTSYMVHFTKVPWRAWTFLAALVNFVAHPLSVVFFVMAVAVGYKPIPFTEEPVVSADTAPRRIAPLGSRPPRRDGG